jgi:hypothetical protein
LDGWQKERRNAGDHSQGDEEFQQTGGAADHFRIDRRYRTANAQKIEMAEQMRIAVQ